MKRYTTINSLSIKTIIISFLLLLIFSITSENKSSAQLVMAVLHDVNSVKVDTYNDELDLSVGNGMCSLREAIQAVNTMSTVDSCVYQSVDIIELGTAGTYNLTLTGTEENFNLSGDLDVSRDVTILGFGTKASNTTIDANSLNERAFHLTSGSITLRNLKITNGIQMGDGGAILAAGLSALTLSDLEITNNTAAGSGIGGAVKIVSTATTTIDMCTISGNMAGGFGGGIYFDDSGSTLTINNSTFSGNSGQSGGGLYYKSSTGNGVINNCTFTMDTAANTGSEIFNDSGTLAIKNSIIDGDCDFSFGNNFSSIVNNIENGSTCNFNVVGSLQSTDPLLETLMDNTGLTLTSKLLSGSPAIDAGDTATCLTIDQRDFNRDAMCDIGAYEVAAVDTTAPTLQSATIKGMTLILDYDENLTTSPVPATTDYSIIETVSSMDVGLAISNLSIASDKVTITLSTSASEGSTVKISYTAGSNPLKDTAGNSAVDLINEVVTNNTDTTAPTIQTSTINGTDIQLDYSESLDNSSTPNTSDYTVKINGTTDSVTMIVISNDKVDIKINTAVTSSDTVTITYFAGANPIKDLSGNLATDFSDSALTNNTTPATDTTSPVLTSKGVNGEYITLNYDEALDPGSTPTVGDYSITVNSLNRNISSVTILNQKVTLRLLTPVSAGDTLTLSYTPGANPVQDTAGNDAANISSASVTNNTPANNEVVFTPTVDSDKTSPFIENISINKNTLTIDYSEDISSLPLPDIHDFSIATNNKTINALAITINKDIVTLDLTEAVLFGDNVTFTYSGSIKSVKDLSGNKANNVTNISVINNTEDPTPPAINSSEALTDKITLTYNKKLFAKTGIEITDFKAFINNTETEIFSISIDENKIIIKLSKPITNTDKVNISYLLSKSAIEDSNGNKVGNLNKLSIENKTPDKSPPLLTSTNINKDLLNLVFNKALDENSIPSKGSFAVQSDNTIIDVSEIKISKNTITIKVNPPVNEKDKVTVSFTSSSSSQIKDLASNTAESFSNIEVNNITKTQATDTESEDGETTSENTEIAEEDIVITKIKPIDESVNFYNIPDSILKTFNLDTIKDDNYVFAGSSLSFEITDPSLNKKIDSLSNGSNIKVKIFNKNNKFSVLDAKVINISNNQRIIKTTKTPLDITEGKSTLVLSVGDTNIGRINIFGVNNISRAQSNSSDLAPEIKKASVIVTGNIIRVIIKGNNFYANASQVPLNINSSARLTDVSVMPGKKVQNTIKISANEKLIVLRLNSETKTKSGNYLINVFTPFGQATEVVYIPRAKQRTNNIKLAEK